MSGTGRTAARGRGRGVGVERVEKLHNIVAIRAIAGRELRVFGGRG